MRAFVHPLMILGFDIYKLPAADVIETLKGLKFDLSILREDTWAGHTGLCGRTKPGDLPFAQFWIDQKNLYFVRTLRPAGKDGAQTQRRIQQVPAGSAAGGWRRRSSSKSEWTVRTTEEYSEDAREPSARQQTL